MFYLHGDHLTLHVLTHSFPTRRSSDLDLVVLDITLPGRSGFDILKGLRRRSDSTPVLVLTARSEVDDRVSALDLGADDYLVKPFDFREFEARCRALRRRRQGIAGNFRRYGNMVFGRSARQATIAGTAREISNRHSRLLELYLRRPLRELT